MTPTLLLTLAVINSAPVLIDVTRLAGEWRGESQFGRCTIVFWPNGACVEKSAGRLRAASYRVDPHKRPAEIDFWDRGAKARAAESTRSAATTSPCAGPNQLATLGLRVSRHPVSGPKSRTLRASPVPPRRPWRRS